MVLYKEFKVGDLFDIGGSKKVINKNMITKFNGKYPYVTRTEMNNGVSDYIEYDEESLNEGNTITLGMDTYVINYQPTPYYTGNRVKVIKYEGINKYNARYVVTALRKLFIGYSWGMGIKQSQMNDMNLQLPVKTLEDTEPDWEYMEEYIKQKELAYIGKLNKEFEQKKEQLIELIGEESEYINIEELPTAKFKVGDLMDIVGSKKSIHKNMITRLDGEKPYVTRTEKNNGISEYIEFEDKYLNEGNTISLGLDTYVVNYQEKPYYTGNKIKVIKYEGINKINALYIVGVLRKVFSEYKWGMGINQKQLENLEIELPVKVEGINEPDWETMEKYIARVELQLLNRITNTLNT